MDTISARVDASAASSPGRTVVACFRAFAKLIGMCRLLVNGEVI